VAQAATGTTTASAAAAFLDGCYLWGSNAGYGEWYYNGTDVVTSHSNRTRWCTDGNISGSYTSTANAAEIQVDGDTSECLTWDEDNPAGRSVRACAAGWSGRVCQGGSTGDGVGPWACGGDFQVLLGYRES
jgi:hypothetical protein